MTTIQTRNILSDLRGNQNVFESICNNEEMKLKYFAPLFEIKSLNYKYLFRIKAWTEREAIEKWMTIEEETALFTNREIKRPRFTVVLILETNDTTRYQLKLYEYDTINKTIQKIRDKNLLNRYDGKVQRSFAI